MTQTHPTPPAWTANIPKREACGCYKAGGSTDPSVIRCRAFTCACCHQEIGWCRGAVDGSAQSDDWCDDCTVGVWAFLQRVFSVLGVPHWREALDTWRQLTRPQKELLCRLWALTADEGLVGSDILTGDRLAARGLLTGDRRHPQVTPRGRAVIREGLDS